MYPLLELGPLRISSSGVLLLLGFWLSHWLFVRQARQSGGEQLADYADRSAFAALLGAALGGRVWFGLWNWELYAQTPSLWWALRINDLAWGGALLGGMLGAWLWCRAKKAPSLQLADLAVQSLPFGQALACVGLLLSGDAFGAPTQLAWGIDLFGTTRHPTQILMALAALATGLILRTLGKQTRPAGSLLSMYLALQSLSLLLIEALRGDSLIMAGGIRVNQILGLALLLGAFISLKTMAEPKAQPAAL
jgi:phosphatidylglycerol:prolipoprotein diacylglycerol transferase